jgi:hypothetical protein
VNRLDLAKTFVQAVLAAAAELANAWLPPQNLSACSGMDKITVSWDKSGENNSYKLFKDNTFFTETTENYYEDYDVQVGNKYEYYVVAVHNGQEGAPSNKDEVKYVAPLQLPYFNDFSVDKYGFVQSDWALRNKNGKSSLCNTQGDGVSINDNYLSFAELDWFPIPHNTENISIRFKWLGSLKGIWYNTGMFFEVTNDRKTWHKLAYISGIENNWMNCEFSLKQFINNDFFQARFRLESSGALFPGYQFSHIGFITDVEIDYVLGPDTISVNEHSPYISSFNFTPNPANDYINVITNQHEPYNIAIYDMTGRVVFVQDGFNDGTLSVAHLKTGNYLIVASTEQHRVARKLVKR